MTLKSIILRQKEYLPFWIALVIVTIVSAVTFHTDFLYLTALASRTADGNLNLYQALILKGADTGSFAMPPLIGYLDAAIFYVFKHLGILNFDLNYGFQDHIPTLKLLLLKSRYILIFILSYPLAYKAGLYFTKNDTEVSRRIANIWITSPILLYLPFAQGNNDIYPVVASLAFLALAFKGNNIWAMVFLGVTAALKSYGVFLILPVALILARKDLKKTLLYAAIAVFCYLLPSIIYSHGLANFAIIPDVSPIGTIEKTLMLRTVIPSNINYMVFVVVYFMINAFLFYNDNAQEIIENRNKILVRYCFLVLSLFFVTFFIPQWFLWILPFFVFIIFENRKLFSLYIVICSTFLLSLITNWSNNLDAVLWKQLAHHYNLPLGTVFFPGIKTDFTLMSEISSVFVAFFIVFIYYLITEKGQKHELPSKLAPYQSLATIISFVLLMALFCFITIHNA